VSTTIVTTERGGPVATIALNDPERRNALGPALLDALGNALEAAIADPVVRVIVLTHTGPVFSAGADLKAGGLAPGRWTLERVLAIIQDASTPIVARLDGHAFGGGLGLAAACDISIASTDARFGFTEVRVGVVPAIISVVCLPKLSRSDALELFLEGERIDAERAAAAGLLTRAVTPENLDAEVRRHISALLRGGPMAIGIAKRLVLGLPQIDRAEALERMAALSREVFASSEAQEGMAAFRERRLPTWCVDP